MNVTLRLVLPRPASRSTSTAFARDEIHAGSRPENIAAAIVDRTVKASTGASTSNVIQDGGGFSRFLTVADNQSIDAYARTMPTSAPIPATSRLSVSIWRTSRVRVAPSEERTASSFARSVARANCMFITFTHEMSNTPTQNPSIVHSVPRSGRGVYASSSGCTWPVLNFLFVSEYAVANRLARVVASAFA